MAQTGNCKPGGIFEKLKINALHYSSAPPPAAGVALKE